MLSRGVLHRFAAEFPKPRIFLSALNGVSRPTVAAFARAYNAAIVERRHTFATKSATEPTTKVKKDVKKTAAKKPATKTKATAKKPTAKKKATAGKATRKTAAKKKAVPKKPRKALGRQKKTLTEEQKQAQAIKELKKVALRPPPHAPLTPWVMFVGESTKGVGGFTDARHRLTDAAAKYKNLTAAEREHYNHLAKETTETRRAEYDAWMRQQTPDQIRRANNARAQLRRKLAARTGKPATGYPRLHDDRQPKQVNAYMLFTKERHASGDLKSIALTEATSLVASEWKALSASEKKKYQDAATAQKAAATT